MVEAVPVGHVDGFQVGVEAFVGPEEPDLHPAQLEKVGLIDDRQVSEPGYGLAEPDDAVHAVLRVNHPRLDPLLPAVHVQTRALVHVAVLLLAEDPVRSDQSLQEIELLVLPPQPLHDHLRRHGVVGSQVRLAFRQRLDDVRHFRFRHVQRVVALQA